MIEQAEAGGGPRLLVEFLLEGIAALGRRGCRGVIFLGGARFLVPRKLGLLLAQCDEDLLKVAIRPGLERKRRIHLPGRDGILGADRDRGILPGKEAPECGRDQPGPSLVNAAILANGFLSTHSIKGVRSEDPGADP